MPSERITISNISQFMGLAGKAPSILNIGGFSALRSFASAKPGGCACNKKAGLIQMRPQFEASLSVLTTSEQNQLKNLLDTKEICYYAKQPGGQLKLNCF